MGQSGCGDGVFTRALASLLPPRSIIHAMDRDAVALRALPAEEHGVTIRPWTGDVTDMPWPFGPLDGQLLANLLHYVGDAGGVSSRLPRAADRAGHLLVVEYNTKRANPWVPYPLPREALTDLCMAAGFARVAALGSRPSIYRRAPLSSALVKKG